MAQTNLESQPNLDLRTLPSKLWIYTNYDCNLRCSYCVAGSSPRTPRRALGFATVQRIIDEAVDLGFQNLYFTGGEPFLLDDIYAMLAYAAAKVTTTVLTNAILFRGKRLERFSEIFNENLVVQVSLDGDCPEHHDPYRGTGNWEKTVEGIRMVQERNARVRISTTETPANAAYLDKTREFLRSLGIPVEDHIIRPLVKRGFSAEGMDVSKECLVPELTINADGIYWHPLSTDPDFLVSPQIFPLEQAASQAQAEIKHFLLDESSQMQAFR